MLIARHIDNPFSDNCYTQAITDNYNKWFIDNAYLLENTTKNSLLTNYEFKAMLRNISIDVDFRVLKPVELEQILYIHSYLCEIYGFNRTIQQLEILLKCDIHHAINKLIKASTENKPIASVVECSSADEQRNLNTLSSILALQTEKNRLDVVDSIQNADNKRVIGNIFVAKAVYGYRDNDTPQIAVNINDTRSIESIQSDYAIESEPNEPPQIAVDF